MNSLGVLSFGGLAGAARSSRTVLRDTSCATGIVDSRSARTKRRFEAGDFRGAFDEYRLVLISNGDTPQLQEAIMYTIFRSVRNTARVRAASQFAKCSEHYLFLLRGTDPKQESTISIGRFLTYSTFEQWFDRPFQLPPSFTAVILQIIVRARC
jgi:hypothetical protein